MKLFPAVFAVALASAVSSARAIDWPEFRGPWGDGRVSVQGDTNIVGIPAHWSDTENVKWKIPIHDKGWSTPVILNGQIWLTTATADGRDDYVLCVDQATGKIQFDYNIFHNNNPEPLGNDLNGYASPSPTAEPGRVYVHFGSYGTACLDTATHAVLWQRRDIPCRHFRGPGSSVIIYSNLLILTMDGIDLQYLTALDKNTGKTVWKTDRTAAWNDLEPNGHPRGDGDFRKAFSTPLVIDWHGVTQMLTVGTRDIYSYDPLTGRELWKVQHDGYSGASRPLFRDGLAFIATGNGKAEMLGMRVDGTGEVTKTAVQWRVNRAAPTRPSPVLADGMLFMLADSGVASCLDCATGQEHWRERIGGEYSASTLYADGRVYYFSQQGKVTIVKAAPNFESLATIQMPSGFMSSPAVSGKALYLRTKTDLYRIEE